jgi:arylsulfatase A-like enzyme
MLNVLFITVDQFRGDCLSSAGHPVVRTPGLDELAGHGVRFDRHASQAAPCGPGRACLYTGTYQMNNRVVGNGTPLDHRFDNIARVARRAGYRPVLFGYTDQAIDPRTADGPEDPRLQTYQGVLPGFDAPLELGDEQEAWRAWLAELGYGEFRDGDHALATEPERPVEHGVSTFLTDRLLAWLRRQDGPWFVHASFWRPHHPYAAAGHWSTAYDPDEVGDPLPRPSWPIPPCGNLAAPVDALDAAAVRRIRAQYLGMVSDVDAQLGRLWSELRELGAWDDTLVIVTADHGEQLGDQGQLGKGGLFPASYHVPCIVRDPRQSGSHGTVVRARTENVDLLATLCEALGLDVPVQSDGLSLMPFVRGEEPPWWRTEHHWEYDWRWERILFGPYPWPWDRRLESMNLAVLAADRWAYVQFAGGESICLDLAADPTWGTTSDDVTLALAGAQAMLSWRAKHTDRTFTDMLVYDGGVGRVPEVEPFGAAGS